MATALDLLMSTKEDVNLLSEESDICTIVAKTRTIFVPSTIVVGGVQSDKNAERIKFSCPKIVGDNLDLSKFSVRINFENVSSVDFNVSIKDQYICDDVAVDGENVTFSWLIGRNAARYMGTVRFIVCAVKTDSDSNISVEWNTAIAEVPVLEGIEIDQPQIGQEEKDVINQLLELTKNTSAEAVQNVNSAKEQAIKDIQSVSQPDTTLTIEGGLAEAKATGEAIGSIKEDISTKITKFYASSQGETHLADSDNGKIMDMMMYGKSEQKQYSGYQLIDKHITSDGTYNGLTYKTINIGEIQIHGINNLNTDSNEFQVVSFTNLAEGKYTVSVASTDNNVSIRVIINNVWHESGTFDIQPEDTVMVWLNIKASATVNGTIKIMLEKGSEAHAYEPYTGGIPSPNPDYPQEIKSVVNPTVKLSNEDGTQFKTVTLPYTLNAIPVESGGNVTINGQQYVSDYADVERGKLVRMVSPVAVLDSGYGPGNNNSHQVPINKYIKNTTNDKIGIILCDKLRPASADDVWSGVADNIVSTHAEVSNMLTFRCTTKANDMDSALKFIKSCKIYIALAKPEEIDLTPEEIAAFKSLATYYPTTNISINSEQLDGYTVFNYPISMQNGWDYVKQQIGDTREYIYDMDARTQNTDLQAAEAYVNSEYAVALTELEV
jgi:hypothetical protein